MGLGWVFSTGRRGKFFWARHKGPLGGKKREGKGKERKGVFRLPECLIEKKENSLHQTFFFWGDARRVPQGGSGPQGKIPIQRRRGVNLSARLKRWQIKITSWKSSGEHWVAQNHPPSILKFRQEEHVKGTEIEKFPLSGGMPITQLSTQNFNAYKETT